jgi:hypothetical protein
MENIGNYFSSNLYYGVKRNILSVSFGCHHFANIREAEMPFPVLRNPF